MSTGSVNRLFLLACRNRIRRFKKTKFELRRRSLCNETLEDRRLLFAASLHQTLATESFHFGQESSYLSGQVVQAVGDAAFDLHDTLVTNRQDHFHGSDFTGSASKINERYLLAVKAADPAALDMSAIASNFGKIVHAAQDFYAHSNWTDIISGGYLPSNSLIESGFGFWNDLTPFSVQDFNAFQHPESGLTYKGVMLAEVPQLFEPTNPETPVGVASAIGKFTENVPGQGDRNIAWVEAGNQRFAAVVSGTFALQPSRCGRLFPFRPG